MAVTIIKNFTSNKFYPSANPINCTISSNNSGKCNFRYICDVYINGTKVFSDKLFPDPTTGYAFFQISRVLQDYIETSIPKEAYIDLLNYAATATAPTAALQVYCRFGEEYDNSTECDGTIVQYSNLATSNTFYVFESAIDYEDFPDFDYAKYLVATNSNALFLTNSQRDIEVTYNDSYYLDFITLNTITASYSLQIKGYNYDGSTNFQNTYVRTLSSYRRFRVAVGPFDINAYDNNPIINMDVDYYEVWLQYNNTIISEIFTFRVKDPKPFRTRIGFVGLKGSIEHFTFYHRNRATYNIDRKNYEKLLQSNYSNDWKYEVGDRGTTTYKVSAKETHAVATYCDRDTSEWLYEMWLSPNVWTYRRPDLFSFRPYQDGTAVKFWVDGDHGLKAGDDIFTFCDKGAFRDVYTIDSVDGNIVDCGLLYAVYGADLPACGYVHKVDTWQMLPITISDNSIEVKQKTSRPIEYALNYQMAYQKTTLRG